MNNSWEIYIWIVTKHVYLEYSRYACRWKMENPTLIREYVNCVVMVMHSGWSLYGVGFGQCPCFTVACAAAATRGTCDWYLGMIGNVHPGA